MTSWAGSTSPKWAWLRQEVQYRLLLGRGGGCLRRGSSTGRLVTSPPRFIFPALARWSPRVLCVCVRSSAIHWRRAGRRHGQLSDGRPQRSVGGLWWLLRGGFQDLRGGRLVVGLVAPLRHAKDHLGDHDAAAALRGRGDGGGRGHHRHRRGSGEGDDGAGPAGPGVRAVPGQVGHGDQSGGPADPGGTPALHLRNVDGGADLPRSRPLCQTGPGGGGARRGSHGHPDPQLHHQGRVRQAGLPELAGQDPGGRRPPGRRHRGGGSRAGRRHSGSRVQEGDVGHQVPGRHQDGRLQARTGAAESRLQPGSQHQESRGPAGVRAAGGQGAAEDPLGGDGDRGGAAPQADRRGGTGGPAHRQGAGRQRQAARRGRGLQDAAAGPRMQEEARADGAGRGGEDPTDRRGGGRARAGGGQGRGRDDEAQGRGLPALRRRRQDRPGPAGSARDRRQGGGAVGQDRADRHPGPRRRRRRHGPGGPTPGGTPRFGCGLHQDSAAAEDGQDQRLKGGGGGGGAGADHKTALVPLPTLERLSGLPLAPRGAEPSFLPAASFSSDLSSSSLWTALEMTLEPRRRSRQRRLHPVAA